jgi:predicted dinucleotide-utilizing enzyme
MALPLHRPEEGGKGDRVDTQALLSRLDPQWHTAFLHFIETGEADAQFLAFMDKNEDCQHAVEAAFNEQALTFERLSRKIHEKDDAAVPVAAAGSEALTASVAQVLERALELPPEQRSQVVHKAARALTEAVPPRRQKDLVETLGSQLKVAAAISG